MAHVHTFGDVAPDGPADHPPRGDELLRHRQHRPDPDPRGPRPGPRPARRRDRRPGRRSPTVEGPALPRLHPLPAGPARHRRQAGDALVLRADPRPARGRAAARRPEVPRREGDDRHPGELPRPLRRRPRQGRGARPHGGRGVRVRRDRTRSRARPTRARSTPRSSPRSPASPRAPTGSAPTCACWPTSARSRSRSRPSRSARRRWPTSGTRCGPSGCARSPGS